MHGMCMVHLNEIMSVQTIENNFKKAKSVVKHVKGIYTLPSGIWSEEELIIKCMFL